MVVPAILIVASAGCADRSASDTSVPVPPRFAASIIVTTTTVVRGRDLSGTLRVTNNTGHAVTLASSEGCPTRWVVGLENARIKAVPIMTAMCVNRPLIAAPGTNDWPFTTVSRYPSCTDDASAATSTLPACLPGGNPPPLPAGDYHAVLVSEAPHLPAALPVAVRLVAG